MDGEFTKTMQTAIRESGLTLIEVARRAGVTQGQLSRFMRNERSLTLPAVEKVCKVLGLELRPIGQRKSKGKA